MTANPTNTANPGGPPDGSPSGSSGDSPGRERVAAVQRRTLTVLSAAQISGGIGVAVGLTFSSVTMEELSGSTTLSGLAGTAVVLGAGLLALPTARSSGRGGRRAGLALAYGCALLGCLLSLFAVGLGSWPLLLAGLLLFGAASAGGLASRYAATDLSPPGHSARHLSLVVWATTVGSVAGPNLAGPAERFSAGLGLSAGSGPFALALLGFAISLGILMIALRPDPLLLARATLTAPEASPASGPVQDAPPASGTPAPGPVPDATGSPGRGGGGSPSEGGGAFRTAWRVLRGTPVAGRALVAIAVSHTAMVSVMSMTPVHLDHGGSTYTVIGIVISLHIAGMYVLSPVIGWLADRVGRIPVLVLGMCLLLTACVLAAGAGAHEVTRVTVGLVLLGLGWSCGLISGSAMLSEAVPLQHRTPVQGLSDLLMNVCGATGTVIAGVIVGSLSYGALGATVGVMVAITGAWLALTRA